MKKWSQYSFFKIISAFTKNHELIFLLVKREILAKYRGTFAGLLWVILAPLLMLGLYTLVFGFFIKVKWPGVDNSLSYALVIYVGLIILNFFSECLSRSPSILLANPNFVKKINFPLEIYPFVIIGSALFYFFINSLILTLLCFVILGTLYSSILLLPLLFIPLIFVTLGLSWFLSSLGVFVRDVTHFMVFFLQIVMYLSPIFYSINALPEKVQKCLLANPLTFIIEQARQLIIFGHLPNWSGLGIYFLISIVIASGGFIWFQKTRERFADVL